MVGGDHLWRHDTSDSSHAGWTWDPAKNSQKLDLRKSLAQTTPDDGLDPWAILLSLTRPMLTYIESVYMHDTLNFPLDAPFLGIMHVSPVAS